MTKPILPEGRKAVCLAPMAGFTDAVFRALCRAQGADFTYTEMVSAKGIKYESEKTRALYVPGRDETKLAVQLFGSEPDVMADAVSRVQDELGETLLLIDLNMGCPAQKIVSNGDGSALMREPDKAARIIRAAARVSRVPVTVKFRKGWDEQSANAVSFAVLCEACGASMLTVHGRTRMQQYGGKSDRACIAAVKQAVQIPVLANGDVRSGADARSILAETGCDGVMIGRGALGNPFVFAEVRAALCDKPYTPPCAREKLSTALTHARLEYETKGAHAIVELRKHLIFYLRGMDDAAKLRMRINDCGTLSELEETLLDFMTRADA